MPQRRAWRAADHQLYDIAARLDTVHEDIAARLETVHEGSSTGRAQDVSRSTSPARARQDRDVTSPFYHELEPTTLDSSCVTPSY